MAEAIVEPMRLKQILFLPIFLFSCLCHKGIFKGEKTMLSVGQMVPDLELTTADGHRTKLKSLYENNKLVIFFYPKNFTPGCTKEACTFRDFYAEFKEHGAEVIGISKDTQESHQKFKEEYKLPYQLFSDKDGEIAKAFGVGKTLGFLASRVTFVIDQDGRCILAFSFQASMEQHVDEALKALK